MRITISQETKSKIIELYLSGLKCKKIAETVGVNTGNVTSIVRRAGVSNRTSPKDKRHTFNVSVRRSIYHRAMAEAKNKGVSLSRVFDRLLESWLNGVDNDGV